MPIKIYIRERLKVGSGVKEPRFRIVAVTSNTGDGAHLKIEANHFRKTEIEQIAKDLNADIVQLQTIPVAKRGKMK